MKVSGLLSKNKAWAFEKTEADASFFTKLSQEQKPSIFWIGCCDSRVLPGELFDFSLGEVFMHTNIANQVDMNDLNLMSALDYSVNVLGVEHIIICGHTCCGGVQSAIDDNVSDVLGEWLKPLRELYRENKGLNSQTLSALNIKRQVEKISNCELIQSSWKKRKAPQVHGWMFQLEDGIVREICSSSSF